MIIALWCLASSGRAQSTNTYHTNRVFHKVTFTIPGVPTAFEVCTMAGKLTSVVGPTNVVTNGFSATEHQSVVVGYAASTSAWAATVGAYPSNSMVHSNCFYNNVGWVKGLKQTDDGNWGGYIWLLQNTVNFDTSATNVWVSTNGVTNAISKVLVGTIGDYPAMATNQSDTGPTLEGLTNWPGGSSNDMSYSADFTAYYDIGLSIVSIVPPLTNVCINSGNVTFTLITNSCVTNVDWSITPTGGVTLTGSATNAVVTVGSVATSYVVKVTANNDTNVFAYAVLNVVMAGSPLQYNIGTNGWADMPDPLYVCKDTTVNFKAMKVPTAVSWPGGKPMWGGGLLSGSGVETNSYTFSVVSSSTTDYQIVTAECGNTVTGKVLVVGKVEMTAYRPQTEGPGYGNPFQKQAIPNTQKQNPGAGIRVNGDDDNNNGTPDRDDTTVDGENDLIEVTLDANPPASSGFKYVLKRNNNNIKVWNSQTKGTTYLGANDETNLTFSTTPMTVWVENPNGGTADLELQVQNDASTVVGSDKIHFYPFTGIAIGLSGWVPPGYTYLDNGMWVAAQNFYTNGYDIHYYNEKQIHGDGSGIPYNEITNAIWNRAVTEVAIFGHSKGGGATRVLAQRLNDNRLTIGTFTIPVTVYVDAIKKGYSYASETNLPPSTLYHANYYETNTTGLCGAVVPGATVNLNVNGTSWGAGLTHFTIDDNINVNNLILEQIMNNMDR